MRWRKSKILKSIRDEEKYNENKTAEIFSFQHTKIIKKAHRRNISKIDWCSLCVFAHDLLVRRRSFDVQWIFDCFRIFRRYFHYSFRSARYSRIHVKCSISILLLFYFFLISLSLSLFLHSFHSFLSFLVLFFRLVLGVLIQRQTLKWIQNEITKRREKKPMIRETRDMYKRFKMI